MRAATATRSGSHPISGLLWFAFWGSGFGVQGLEVGVSGFRGWGLRVGGLKLGLELSVFGFWFRGLAAF